MQESLQIFLKVNWVEIMTKKERVKEIAKVFDVVYSDAKCSLDYTKDYELLIAVMLSAQCTDARVNIVTKDLFARYTSLEAFADAELEELESIVKPCGFYHTKAKNIIAAANKIIYDYMGKIPDTIEELITLPGVGRKTANLIVGDIYGKPGVVVDTHCIRLSNRMGLTKEQDPVKIEFELKKIIPDDIQSRFCHQLVLHGRAYCMARKPDCEACPINHVCLMNSFSKKR